MPSIQRQQAASGSSAYHHWTHRTPASSSLSELYGGDEREVERSRDTGRPDSSLSSSSSSSSPATTNLWSRSSKRRPFAGSRVLTTSGVHGHARASDGVASSLAEVTTIDDPPHLVARKLNFDDETTDDETDDSKDVVTTDDQHNNNGNNLGDNIGRHNDVGGEDVACGYVVGVNNNDTRDNDEDEDENLDDHDDDDRNNDDNLNSRHRRFQQRSRYPAADEVVLSPAMRNLLSPAAATTATGGGGGGGGGSLIGVSSIELLTNLTSTNHPRNTELLINNNAQDSKTAAGERQLGEKETTGIPASNEVIRRGAGEHEPTSYGSAFAFLPSSSRRLNADDRDIPNNEDDDNDDDEDEERKLCLSSSSSSDDSSPGSPPPTDTVAGRPSVTHGDDPSVPSTSRRAEQQTGLFSGAACSGTTAGGNLTSSSPTTPSQAHPGFYGAVNEQYVSARFSPKKTIIIILAPPPPFTAQHNNFIFSMFI